MRVSVRVCVRVCVRCECPGSDFVCKYRPGYFLFLARNEDLGVLIDDGVTSLDLQCRQRRGKM